VFNFQHLGLMESRLERRYEVLDSMFRFSIITVIRASSSDDLIALCVQANSIWLYIFPQGLRELMNYIKNKYANPTVLITENGNRPILNRPAHH